MDTNREADTPARFVPLLRFEQCECCLAVTRTDVRHLCWACAEHYDSAAAAWHADREQQEHQEPR
jgi:hypothetical protein